MRKRSTFESVWPFVGSFAAFIGFFSLWHVIARVIWIWNPNGLIDNLNPGIDTTCRAMGFVNCTLESERTFWNFNTDSNGEFYAYVQALCLLGAAILIIGSLIYIGSQFLASTKDPENLIFTFGHPTGALQYSDSEPYVSDDPQHQIKSSLSP